ncbi:MAG: hypothetical protein M1288_05690 [Actinobacteria bacterium]|nr:hypothetical protein [Actinomycetota bacterium]
MEEQDCPSAKFGYARDKKRGKTQIEYGLMTDINGCLISVEVVAVNTSA